MTVTVSGTNGTPTGTVTLASGSYSSGAVTLTGGSAQIVIAAGKLATGTDTLAAVYSPDAGSLPTYAGASGTGSVTVTAPALITPTVTLAGLGVVTTSRSLMLTVVVYGGSGEPTPTGSVTLTSGSYSSGAVSMTNANANITVPAGSLAAGTDTLTATYTPDTNSSSTYTSATGSDSETVIASVMPTVTVTPIPSSFTTAQTDMVTVTVTGGSLPVSGYVTLTSGSYNSGNVTLSGGSGQINIPAGALAVGTDTLTATFTATDPFYYFNGSGTGSVTVTSLTPTVTVTANPSSTSTTGTTTVTIAVSGGSGNPTPTGSVTLTSGTYSSGATTLTSGSAQIVVQGSALATGNSVPLNATYTPDANSSGTYSSATGSGSVAVAQVAITSFTASANPIPYGTASTQLTGVFTGGTGVITPGSLPATSGTPVTVSPTATTTYTLTVTPTTGTAVTQTISVSLATGGVTVNPANPGIAVTDQILGMNMAAWYDEITNANGVNAGFNGAGIKAIRWPGGSWSDQYHWGFQTGSSTLLSPYMCACSSATNCTANSQGWAGTGSFAQFVSKIPLTGPYDLALTANYGTNETCDGGGDPAEAASWVSAATNDGITVSHMTVGNEEYGSWETDLHSTPNSPTIYAAAVNGSDGNGGYYSLIKASSSNTMVGVVVEPNYSPWDQTVMTNDKGSYDFVEYHYYPEAPGSENDNTLIKQDAQALTTNINKIKSELNKWGTPNTPIYVGEIGGPYSNPGKQSWSITQGLYAGQVLGEMMNDGVSRLTWWIGFGNCNGNEGNNSSSLYGWQNFGGYNVFSDGPGDIGPNSSPCNYGGNGTIGAMSPTAVAFDLFSNVAVNGENVLTPSVAGDTADVVAYAATHSGGTAIVVFNRNETTSEPVTITLTGKSNSSGVTWYWYDKEMYDYTNTNCATALNCTVDPNHNYGSIDWAGPASTSLGAQTLPLTVTLQPWSMNVFIIP